MLDLLPVEIADQVDASELLPARGRHELMRRALERVLGCHVVAYRAGFGSSGQTLCQVIEPARITRRAIWLVRFMELCVRDTVFVAYYRPLQLRLNG